MTIDAARFQKRLNDFKLDQLFNELGWDHAGGRPTPVLIGEETFNLTPIAQKRGVLIYQCGPDASGGIPLRATLLKIEKEVVKLSHEHLLIFTDAACTTQAWLWVSRIPGQPAAIRTHTWHKGTSGEALRQKLEHIAFSLDEEESLTLTLATQRLRDAFDRDRVTKRFYERFSSEHKAFAAFIDGIGDVARRDWYASLMLNRLMFVYFIQRKGFLDGNINYLADRLREVQAKAGKGKFHSFYRLFLRRLFHEGLGKIKPRGAELDTLLGDIPYLNGGLFAVHELEEENPDIDIPDEAFEALFAFFGAYDWHLDDRPLSSGSEINPDVLGYIFEKYINQKQMGAYYTKEDITGYISKNTVVPHLLEQARERCKVAFEGEASVWNLLKADPDRYIYPAMKTGVIDARGDIVPETALPDFVQAGMKDPKARMFERRYNLGEAIFHTATGERGTLPTETWREYVERRTRCLAVRDKQASGEVKSADDLITLNLDIRQFMQDVIDTCSGPDLLRAVWQAIVGRVPERANEKFRHGITILDPTCGSGAFLFAALNVLEPLYEACLDRMEGFVEDARRLPSPNPSSPSPSGRGARGEGAFADFVKVLDEVARHPSRRYFIYKSIILHNLFGVDIMAEAVEICKLRLFLKLVSQVDGGREMEPLPDIDFNIRAGNTLVGYATEAQFDAANTLASDQAHRDEIKASTADLADLFDRFREQQTVHGGKVTADDKRKLRDKLNGLSLELDRYLAHDYGIDPDNADAFADWRARHQPFHWFAEFYGVMREGGFDVVIGNPPYLEYSRVAGYRVSGFATERCNNLYAMTVERSLWITQKQGRLGMIIPISMACSGALSPLRELILDSSRSLWLSHFSNRPGQLFTGAQNRLTIMLTSNSVGESACLSTKYHRWNSRAGERDALFPTLQYQAIDNELVWFHRLLPKVGSEEAASVLRKIKSKTTIEASCSRNAANKVYWVRVPGYFCQFFCSPPMAVPERGGPPRLRGEVNAVAFSDEITRSLVHAALNSSIYYLFFCSYTDTRHVNPGDVAGFPLDVSTFSEEVRVRFSDLSKEISDCFQRNTSKWRKSGLLIDSVDSKPCKSILDRVDSLLAEHFRLSPWELDVVVNYDIKYRIGGADEEE